MKKIKGFFIFLLLAAALIIMRAHFINEPLERDEGGYAYIGKCLLEGKVMYRDIWEIMPPGLAFIYAFIFKLYGAGFYSIRIFGIFWGLIGLLFIYLTAEAAFGRKTAPLCAGLYSIFSGGPVIHGSGGNTEPYMIVFLTMGLYFFILSEKSNNIPSIIAAGFFTGLGCIIKQSALMNLCAFVLFYIIYYGFLTAGGGGRRDAFKKIILLAAGFLLAWAPFLIYCARHDLWKDFTYAFLVWHFTHGRTFLDEGFLARLYNSFLHVSKENSILWILSIGAVTHIVLNEKNRMNVLLTLWGVFSFIGVCLGGMFYPHYYIQVVPFLALASGYLLEQIMEGITKKEYWQKAGNIFVVIALSAMCFSIISYEYKYFIYSPEEVSIAKYKNGIFVAAKDIAEYIKENSSLGDTVFVWGMEPEIYFYSERECAARYIHTYSVLGKDSFACEARQEIMRDIDKKKPIFIVPAFSLDSFQELKEYVEKNYTAVDYRGINLYKINTKNTSF